MQILSERGYLIMAVNSASVDYINCASTLARSIRTHHPDAKICLLSNSMQQTDPKLFDYNIVLHSVDTVNPWANDWQCWTHSPFRQTIKLEADMVITSPIEHWWTMFEHRDVVISTGCRDFYNNTSTCRRYRKLFDDNNLPDVYNAITYWRVSETAKEFWDLVKNIFGHWDQYRTLLKFPDEVASTDVVYAMAAKIMGEERITMPYTSYPKIVHMKRGIIPIKQDNWTKELVWEYHNAQLKINTVAQYGAVHYNIKDWHPDE